MLAISNLATNNLHELAQLTKYIEIAPSTISSYDNLIAFTNFRHKVESFGLTPICLQSILYNTTFQLAAPSPLLCSHFNNILDISNILSVKTIVIGSPKNRKIVMNKKQSIYQMAKFLSRIAEKASEFNITFVLEANPIEYGCELFNNFQETAELIELIDHPNLRLHLDTGCFYLCKDNPDLILKYIDKIKHIHVSEPDLIGFKNGKVNHSVFTEIIKEKYNGTITMEVLGDDNLQENWTFFKKLYGK